MKKNLEILEIEAKLTKDEKKYWRVQTRGGKTGLWMSVFDVVAIEAIKEMRPITMLCCEVIEKKGKNFKGEDTIFYNITKCYGAAEEHREAEDISTGINWKKDEERSVGMGMVDEFGNEKPEVEKSQISLDGQAQAAMYVSYAKDVFCAMVEKGADMTSETMKEAISRIKQAKEAFE